MERYDIRIPYIEVRDKNTRDIIGMVEGAEIFFEYNFHDCGSFEIYCRADDNAIELLKKDRYVTLPVNADSVANLIEQNSNMWVIQKIQKTNDAAGGRWIVATGKEAKQIVDKRIIRNTAKLDRNADVSTEVRTKLFTPNLLSPTDTKRPINGFVFTENTVGVKITQDTQVTYDNLFTYTEELYKAYGVGAKLRLDRNTKNMIYTIYSGIDRSNNIIFSQGNDNLLNSDYVEDWAEYKTSALVGGEEKEEIETDPDTGETIRKYTTRTMVVIEDNSTDTDRCEVFVDAKDLQSSYNEDVNGVSVERTYTPDVYRGMLKARGKEKLASENNVVREFNGEIDTVNNKNTFNIDYYLGDLIKIRDDDLQKEIIVRVSKFTKVQNDEGYKEYFEYEEIPETTDEQVEGALLTEDDETLLTEDDNVLLVEEVPTTYSTRSVSTTSAVGGVRISELPEATNINEDCCLPIVSEYETKRITYGGLKERLSNDLDISGDTYDDTEIRNEIADVRNNIPTKTSQLENDNNYLTSYTETDPTVPDWAKQPKKPEYDYSEIKNTPIAQGGGLPIGSIIKSTCKQNNAGLHLADGGELAIGGSYDAFCQYVIANQADFPTTDLTTYQSELDTYGQCGKYVITDTYVKLPKITKMTESANSFDELGQSVKAGLPNITGGFNSNTWNEYGFNTYTDGAFTISSGSNDEHMNVSWKSGSYRRPTPTRFDANQGATVKGIYGNSDTVQPQATKYYYYIVVATVTKTDIEVNLDNVLTDLNGKLGVATYENYRRAVKIFEATISSTSTNTLTRPITDFSLICIRTKWEAGYSDFMTIPSSELLNIGSASARLVSSTDALYASYYFPSATTFIRNDASSSTFTRIFGIL